MVLNLAAACSNAGLHGFTAIQGSNQLGMAVDRSKTMQPDLLQAAAKFRTIQG